MIAFKKKYIIFIETIKDIDLRKIKKKINLLLFIDVERKMIKLQN